MAKSTLLEQQFLGLIFNGNSIISTGGLANIAQNATSPLTTLYVALHTADPGYAGPQSNNEVTYTSYARVAVARSNANWVVSGSAPAQVVPAANIQFPAGTGGSGTATYWSVGVASSGATGILYSGSISPSIVTGNGVTPILTTASTITEQ
jgi:hypothetical protein